VICQGNRTLVVFGAGDEVAVTSGDEGVRFLLISGAPLREPVAWHGPIVMNTQAELQTADARVKQWHLYQNRCRWLVGQRGLETGHAGS
jgi:redox-sensitive bicupin YhaK (pirin superfamily)